MISAAQLTQLRKTAHNAIAATFATTITIGEHENIPAARWSAKAAAKVQGIGTLLPEVDIVVRVARTDLATRSIALEPERTIFTESGTRYRLSGTRSAKGDPGIVMEGKLA